MHYFTLQDDSFLSHISKVISFIPLKCRKTFTEAVCNKQTIKLHLDRQHYITLCYNSLDF